VLGGESWRMGVVNLAVLACVLRRTTKKVVNFLTFLQGSYYFAEFIFPDFSRQNE